MRFITLSKFLLISLTPFVLFLLVANIIGLNNSFFQNKILQYGVQEKIPDAFSLHEKVVNFIKGKSNELPGQFNEREKQHLFDVKKVVKISSILLLVFAFAFAVLLIISAFMLKINNYIINFISRILIYGGFLTLFLVVLLVSFIYFDFSAAFESFHSFFFKRGTYTFDSAREIIVRLYPEQIFMDFGLEISKWVLIASCTVILLGIVLLFKSGSKKNK